MDVETSAEVSVKRLVEIENAGDAAVCLVAFTKIVGDNRLCNDGEVGCADCLSELG
jgi:hypothetical protein